MLSLKSIIIFANYIFKSAYSDFKCSEAFGSNGPTFQFLEKYVIFNNFIYESCINIIF